MNKLELELNELVNNDTLESYKIERVSVDGEVGVESHFRNTERLTLVFPNGKQLVVNTFCSGCAENSCFV